MICRFRHCRAELPYDINGHRRYCDEFCNYAERLEREREKNAMKKSALSELIRIEALLRACSSRYGDTPFDIDVLRELNMNWSIISDTLTLENVEYRVVGFYAYAAFNNNTIKIIKL